MQLNQRRKIAVVSSSRADYGHLYWILRELQQAEDVDLRIIATASHLSERFGQTLRQFRQDGFEVEATTECLLDSDTDTGMAKTIGIAVLGLSDLLSRMRPDLLLLIADRYEMLAPASVALALRIPMAHIEGGEISEGAVDDAVRNALTKMAHLHFTSTTEARRRVMALGEAGWRVHRAGAPSLDHLLRSELPDRTQLEQTLGMALTPPPCVVSCHPVTLLPNPDSEVDALFDALETLQQPIVFTFPNADAGHEAIIRRAEAFCGKRQHARLYTNLGSRDYWALLKQAAFMVGNSSSGIMESPSLALPCVNVGQRQQGRERARNIIDAPAEREAIIQAMQQAASSQFRDSLQGMSNPYGDGTASQVIARVLRETPLDQRLLMKQALPLQADQAAFAHD